MLPHPPTSTLFPYTTLFRSIIHRSSRSVRPLRAENKNDALLRLVFVVAALLHTGGDEREQLDRKSTRLNSSHRCISYAVFCLKKKNNKAEHHTYHEDQLYNK